MAGKLVWTVVLLRYDDEGNESLSQVETHDDKTSAEDAAHALLKNEFAKNSKRASSVTANSSGNKFSSMDSLHLTVKGHEEKLSAYILTNALKTGPADAAPEKEGETKGKRKAKKAPKDATADDAARENETGDPDLDDEAPPKKVPVRKNTNVVTDGKPHALDGLKLIFTGTFDSMDRKGCVETAQKYGGSVVSKLKDADYVILGVKPGPKKLDEIEKLGLSTLSEQQFLHAVETGEMP